MPPKGGERDFAPPARNSKTESSYSRSSNMVVRKSSISIKHAHLYCLTFQPKTQENSVCGRSFGSPIDIHHPYRRIFNFRASSSACPGEDDEPRVTPILFQAYPLDLCGVVSRERTVCSEDRVVLQNTWASTFVSQNRLGQSLQGRTAARTVTLTVEMLKLQCSPSISTRFSHILQCEPSAMTGWGS